MEGKHDDERKHLLEHCLAMNIRRCGINGRDTAIVNEGLEKLHGGMANRLPPGDAKNEQIRISTLYRTEAERINKVLSSLSKTDYV
jgi:hypothetical protein